MRNEQMRSTQTHDGLLRRSDAVPARQFARALDCGGDGESPSPRRESRQSWPTARAPGTPRDGGGEVDESAPGAA